MAYGGINKFIDERRCGTREDSRKHRGNFYTIILQVDAAAELGRNPVSTTVISTWYTIIAVVNVSMYVGIVIGHFPSSFIISTSMT